MLGIILLILKILGIIVLCVLGLILLILLLVFFAPIKYSSEGCKYVDKLQVNALVTYLNPIVRVEVRFPDETIVKVKIFGVTVFPAKLREKASDEQKEISKKTGKSGFAEESSATVDKSSKPEKNNVFSGKIAEPSDEQKTKNFKDEQKQDSTKNSTLSTIGYYASLFQENKELILEVLKTILKALKTILPRKCKVHVVFGTGQADVTGFIYGAYCSLKDSLPGEIEFEPVWTEAYVEGEYILKGKIRIIHFIVAVIKIIANKKVRLLIKKLRRV